MSEKEMKMPPAVAAAEGDETNIPNGNKEK